MASDTHTSNVSKLEAFWALHVRTFLQQQPVILRFILVGMIFALALVAFVTWPSPAAQIKSTAPFKPREIIVLEVGGTEFKTSRKTIFCCGPNLLTKLVDEWENATKEFPIFIDRSPVLFSPILEYLRTGRYFLPPQISGWPQLINEIEYYGLRSPYEHVRPIRTALAAFDNVAVSQAEVFLNRTARRIASALKEATQKSIQVVRLYVWDTQWPSNHLGPLPTLPNLALQAPFPVTRTFCLLIERLLLDTIPSYTTTVGQISIPPNPSFCIFSLTQQPTRFSTMEFPLSDPNAARVLPADEWE